MYKYWAQIKREFTHSLAYRSEVFLWLILDTIPIVVMLFVWLSVYGNQEAIHNYTISQVLQYYLIASMINGLTASHFEASRVEQIRKGQIDFFLTRPLSYLNELFLSHVGSKLYYLLFSLSLLALIYFVLSWFFPLGSIQLTVSSGLQFLVLLMAAFAIEFLLASLIVLLGFWFEHSEGLEHFKWITITLFSGWMIPIALMPTWLATLVQQLPLKYLYAVPIGVLQRTTSLTPIDVVYLACFVGGLVALNLFTWHHAQYRYTSQGG